MKSMNSWVRQNSVLSMTLFIKQASILRQMKIDTVFFVNHSRNVGEFILKKLIFFLKKKQDGGGERACD